MAITIPDKPIELGRFLESRLKIPHAGIFNPGLLALVAASAFANNEITPMLYSISSVIGDSYIQYGQRANISPKLFEKAYIDLIGTDPNLSTSPLAKALKQANKTLTDDEFRLMQFRAGQLLAYVMISNPGLVTLPLSQVKIDYAFGKNGNLILDRDTNATFPFSKLPSSRVLNYGPGLAAIKTLDDDVKKSEHTFLVDISPFVAGALNDFAIKKGVFSKVTISDKGMKAESQDLLESERGRIGMVFLAGVHYAGINEVTAGIQNGAELLGRNGLFIIRCPETVREPNYVTAQEMVDIANSTFGKIEPDRVYKAIGHSDIHGTVAARIAVYKKS